MSDVTLSYKGSDILELSDSGSATLKTGGTYCEADIELEYVKPSGGSSERVFTKLGEYTVTEPVSQITIPETEQMQGCECLYIRVIDVALSAADWIYPVVNNRIINSGGMGYTDKVSTWNAYVRLLQSFKNSAFTTRMCAFDSITNAKFLPYENVTRIDFKLYTSGVTFNSGTIEIWGYV